MDYEEVELLKQSEKSTVYLVRKKDEEQFFIRKVLKGRHPVYEMLQHHGHPGLPKLYEVILLDDSTTIIEEYIEGQSSGSVEFSKKQFLIAVRELCSVLEFLHGKGIIHRDLKPSNIILAKDGHIRLIDFDAARMPKDDLEQDTRLLGTRGYAPPEQYGFAQTDERTDIYSLGITLKQLLEDRVWKHHYKRIIRKCTNLNPDKRYQSVSQVKRAFFHREQSILCAAAAILLAVLLWNAVSWQSVKNDGVPSEKEELVFLPAPEEPHWNGETGIALWGNIFESGILQDEVEYKWRLYRMDRPTPPNLDESVWYKEGDMGSNMQEDEFFEMNFTSFLQENGFYYFAVAASGDGIHYTDSPYVISDAFEYTGESAPYLPAPTGLTWRMFESEEGKGRIFYAAWSNLEDYEDRDSFNVTVYDKSGNYVMNNIWTKEYIMERGYDGIQIRREFLTEADGAYRFTVQALTSRPNEYQSSLLPDPVPEEYFSPWYYN